MSSIIRKYGFGANQPIPFPAYPQSAYDSPEPELAGEESAQGSMDRIPVPQRPAGPGLPRTALAGGARPTVFYDRAGQYSQPGVPVGYDSEADAGVIMRPDGTQVTVPMTGLSGDSARSISEQAPWVTLPESERQKAETKRRWNPQDPNAEIILPNAPRPGAQSNDLIIPNLPAQPKPASTRMTPQRAMEIARTARPDPRALKPKPSEHYDLKDLGLDASEVGPIVPWLADDLSDERYNKPDQHMTFGGTLAPTPGVMPQIPSLGTKPAPGSRPEDLSRGPDEAVLPDAKVAERRAKADAAAPAPEAVAGVVADQPGAPKLSASKRKYDRNGDGTLDAEEQSNMDRTGRDAFIGSVGRSGTWAGRHLPGTVGPNGEAMSGQAMLRYTYDQARAAGKTHAEAMADVKQVVDDARSSHANEVTHYWAARSKMEREARGLGIPPAAYELAVQLSNSQDPQQAVGTLVALHQANPGMGYGNLAAIVAQNYGQLQQAQALGGGQGQQTGAQKLDGRIKELRAMPVGPGMMKSYGDVFAQTPGNTGNAKGAQEFARNQMVPAVQPLIGKDLSSDPSTRQGVKEVLDTYGSFDEFADQYALQGPAREAAKKWWTDITGRAAESTWDWGVRQVTENGPRLASAGASALGGLFFPGSQPGK